MSQEIKLDFCAEEVHRPEFKCRVIERLRMDYLPKLKFAKSRKTTKHTDSDKVITELKKKLKQAELSAEAWKILVRLLAKN